ncbi:MAG: hypothetical protein ACR2H3_04790, partial [Acidimicrobiales bacterium]
MVERDEADLVEVLSTSDAGSLAEVGSPADDDRRLQIAAIDHRLKTAFVIIAGWAKTLDVDWDRLSEENKRHGIATIRARAEAMVGQAERLMAELQFGVAEPIGHPGTNLVAICRDAANAYDASTDHIVSFAGEGQVMVAAEIDLVDQILAQLLENAVKFS